MNPGFVAVRAVATLPVRSSDSALGHGDGLPINETSLFKLDQHQPPATKRDGSPAKNILLVEDNDDLRTTLGTYLSMMGYDVVPCCDGHFASVAFASGTPVDALVTDLEMPGKSGLELARELTSARPSLPVLIVSGALIRGEMEQEIRNRKWKFIAKPCRLPSILTTLQHLLSPLEERVALSS